MGNGLAHRSSLTTRRPAGEQQQSPGMANCEFNLTADALNVVRDLVVLKIKQRPVLFEARIRKSAPASAELFDFARLRNDISV